MCHGLGLNKDMQNRDWKCIWYHLDKNYITVKESGIILLLKQLKTVMWDCKKHPIVLEFKEIDFELLGT